MLRFVFVTTFYPPHHFGGDAILVRHMAEAVARAGHAVDVIYDYDAYRVLQRGGGDRSSGADHHTNGVRVHALRSRLGALSPLLTHQLGRPVVHRREIERLVGSDVDVVHFHNVSLVGGPGILGYGRALKLYTAHEHWLVCPTHVLWRHDREPCTARQCLRCLAHYRRPPQLWRWSGALDRNARHVDAFCSLSRFSIEKHHEFGFDRPMRLLPPFLPDHQALGHGAGDSAGEFADSEERDRSIGAASGAASRTPPIFLFVGRLERIKGLDDVIPAFAGGDRDAELWIAGNGKHEPELRRLAGGSPRVRFLGWVEPERVRRLLRQARALLVPSAGFEVFPLVLLEAFRDGTAVIARRIGPLPEVVEESAGGLLFSSREQLESAIDRLAGDRELAARLGRNARESFEERWSERSFLERYLDLIATLAREKGRADVLARCSAASASAVEPAPPSDRAALEDREEVRS